MKPNIKDLLRHKFPMDETEQAILLSELSEFEKQLRQEIKELEDERETIIKREMKATDKETMIIAEQSKYFNAGMIHILKELL